MSWEEKKSECISKLPTLLDILEKISLREEAFLLNQGSFRGLFPTHYQEGIFSTVLDKDGRTYLLPTGLLPFTYFRGESQYHPMCKPSLFRPNMTPSRIFLERLRSCELELLINSHPMTTIFTQGTSVRMPDGTYRPISFSVDTLALAQHYGICTELLDLTVNKWVAAFFACTRYVNGKYEPILDDKGYGVFYEYNDHNQWDDLWATSMSSRKLRPVGLQPFSRPGEQGGYILQMSKKQNFNKLCTSKIKFRHDSNVSKLIFNYTNRSKKLFPVGLLDAKAEFIKKSTVFSRLAYNMTISRFFYQYPKDDIQSWMKEQRVRLQETPIISFTEQEKKEFMRDWQKHAQSFYNQIFVRLSYMPSEEIEITDGKDLL